MSRIKKKAIDLFKEAKPLKTRRITKKARGTSLDFFKEITSSSYIPFDSVEDIHQEPGMILDQDLQQELDKLLE